VITSTRRLRTLRPRRSAPTRNPWPKDGRALPTPSLLTGPRGDPKFAERPQERPWSRWWPRTEHCRRLPELASIIHLRRWRTACPVKAEVYRVARAPRRGPSWVVEQTARSRFHGTVIERSRSFPRHGQGGKELTSPKKRGPRKVVSRSPATCRSRARAPPLKGRRGRRFGPNGKPFSEDSLGHGNGDPETCWNQLRSGRRDHRAARKQFSPKTARVPPDSLGPGDTLRLKTGRFPAA